jgi:hypothetical protein
VSLQEYAAAKESEIRDVCSENHQEFVDSIEEIVRMKGDVARLQVWRWCPCDKRLLGQPSDLHTVVLLYWMAARHRPVPAGAGGCDIERADHPRLAGGLLHSAAVH